MSHGHRTYIYEQFKNAIINFFKNEDVNLRNMIETFGLQ